MSDLTGAFKPDVPKARQQALLATFARRPGVHAAGLVKKDAKAADMRLLFYVRADKDHAESIVQELRKHADVAVAEMAKRRGLV